MPVKIHLQNFNADALQSELIVRRGPNPDSIMTTSITSLLGMAAAFAVPGGMDLAKLLVPKSRGATGATLLYAPLQIDMENARTFSSASVTDLDALIRERLAEIAKWRTVREQIRALRYNTTMPKADLQRSAREMLNQLAPAAPTLFDDEKQARQLLGQLALENAQYLKYAFTLLQQKSASITTDTPASRGDNGPSSFNEFLTNEAIRQHSKVITDDFADQLALLLNETLTHYQGIRQNTFTTNLATTIDRNSEAIVLQFFDAATPVSTDKRRVVRTDKFTLTQPGQWQLVTSFGLSFIQYSQRLQSYAIVNNKIMATDLNLFTPALSGYIQVFRRTTGFTRLGAHIGVGVPLAESRGVCFQLGPSIAFGRQNALSVNAGLFTARATRLGSGLSVGDSYTTTTTPPTINRYEWGFQVGVSFQFGLRR